MGVGIQYPNMAPFSVRKGAAATSHKYNVANYSMYPLFREVERFKTHVLLAVYGVDHPGQEICEVLADVLQKRLDHVTLSHLIDTLAKNTQTRLDSADVQFLQRDPVSPAGVFNYSIPNSMSQLLQPLNYYTHQHMQAVMPSARYKVHTMLFNLSWTRKADGFRTNHLHDIKVV
ncbi:hypothetical protein TELCIR_03489 [Teladorsagia circumcincta]|uniref:Uncharacterized protein n=1 Tax=Teladorsagia circumcincta TaxID=45464 RepID=A0A2G9UWE2_TELCI|nr:hypothetical protein TELCIR_03489 [Teladorsagia circumcincta]